MDCFGIVWIRWQIVNVWIRWQIVKRSEKMEWMDSVKRCKRGGCGAKKKGRA